MAQRRVTAVIVSYRSAMLTIACLRSLAEERTATPLSLRAVVVDNASGDAPQIAAAIETCGWSSWVTLIEAPRNGGFAYGNNLGFAHACREHRPDYLHMLNPDALVKPGAVRTLVDFLDTHPEIGIAGSSFENQDGSDWPIAFRFPSLVSEIEGGLKLGLISRCLRPWALVRVMSRAEQPVDWGAGASMMIRRELLEAIGGLDENYFLYFEETEFCWRAKRAGFPMWYVPQSRVIHIRGQSTGVTEHSVAPRRLPDYWFESRRRYFLTTRGPLRAMLIDLLALVAHALGSARLTLQGRRDRLVPHYVRDLLRHSVLHRKNRSTSAERTRLPNIA
jgi:N-acetylglucosaminyl-diphospho-decaprenol L-rhamnosyltransferase